VTVKPETRFRAVLSTSAVIVASQLLMAVAGVVAARSLGPSGRGIVTGILVWSQLLTWLSVFGMNTATSVRVSAGDNPRRALGNAVAYTAVVGGILAVVAVATVPSALSHLGPGAKSLSVWALATIPISLLLELALAIHLALGRVRLMNLCRVIGPLLLVAATLALWQSGSLTNGSFIAASIGSTALQLVVALPRLPWRGAFVDLRSLVSDLSFGLKVHLASLLGLANLRLDILLMSTFVSAAQIGYYGVANNMMMPVSMLASGAAVLLTPVVARFESTGGSPDAVRASQITLVRRDAFRYVGAALAGGALLAGVAPVLVPAVFGSSFDPAVTLVWILIPGYIARSYASVIVAGTTGMKRPWVGNVAEAGGLVVTAALLPILLPRFEATGAAITSTGAYCTSAVIAACVLHRMGKNTVACVPPQESARAHPAVAE
jgi:O-antigen/teichoic acid export membrane protein